MRRQMVAKVPHVQGYWSESMVLLIEEVNWMGEWGDERFCMSQYLPGHPGFSMMLKGRSLLSSTDSGQNPVESRQFPEFQRNQIWQRGLPN